MVQEFNVLRCFSCKRFQVHQVKKAKNWVCKVCGEKQSITKIYGQGSAPDCRRHVQKLNTIQGEREQLMGEKIIDNDEEYEFCNDEKTEERESLQEVDPNGGAQPHSSRWEKFVEVEHDDEESMPEEQLLNGIPVTLDKMAFEGGKKKGKQTRNGKYDREDNEYKYQPFKKRNRTQENDDDECVEECSPKRLKSGRMKQKKWEKSNSKWEKCDSGLQMRQEDENVVSCKNFGKEKEDGRSDSKWEKFAITKKTNVGRKKYENQAMMDENDFSVMNKYDSKQEVNSSSTMRSQGKSKVVLGTNNPKNSQSKWSKFLISSSSTDIDDEDNKDDIDDSTFGAFDTNLVKTQPQNPIGFSSNKAYKTVETISDAYKNQFLKSAQTTNVGSIPVPSFAINARATRSEKMSEKLTSKDLFTTEEDLDGDWWNI